MFYTEVPCTTQMQILFPKRIHLLILPYSDVKLADCIYACEKDFLNTFPMSPTNNIVRIETVKVIMGHRVTLGPLAGPGAATWQQFSPIR